MSQQLSDFMVALAVDAACAQRFHDDPLAELTRAGLTQTEITAVLSGDSHKVRAALGQSYADHLTQSSNKSATKGTRRKPGGKGRKKTTKKKTRTKTAKKTGKTR